VNSQIETKIKGEKVDDEIGVDSENPATIIYAYYQREQMMLKIDSEIELFNILFYLTDRYILDELVKLLTLDEIKELNNSGYIIGKLI